MPLARVELGEHKVEKQDYAYTLQGWIKALSGENFSYALGYFAGDYASIGTHNNLETPVNKGLYNGNIATMSTHTPKFEESPTLTQQFVYDQLNRIKQSVALDGSHANSYKTEYSYDANGNIKTLNRYDIQGVRLDQLSYNYENKAGGYIYNTNKLRWVDDAVSTSDKNDLEDQGEDNYSYDEIGNLTKDIQEEIESIEWTVYGKVSKVIRKPSSSKPDLEFFYDASGNRVAKIVKRKDGTVSATYYLRDAQGNVLSVYEQEAIGSITELSEQHIYGSSRIGMYKPDNSLDENEHKLGLRSYELTDHLGNVSVVVSDLKVGLNAEVVAAYNYYPFGMMARMYQMSGGDYRYGFNGKEKDSEWNSGGAQYDYGFRIYDPRIARFLSVDPLAPDYPWYTPYQFAGNNPIQFIDLDGLEPRVPPRHSGRARINITRYNRTNPNTRNNRNSLNPPLNQPSSNPALWVNLEITRLSSRSDYYRVRRLEVQRTPNNSSSREEVQSEKPLNDPRETPQGQLGQVDPNDLAQIVHDLVRSIVSIYEYTGFQYIPDGSGAGFEIGKVYTSDPNIISRLNQLEASYQENYNKALRGDLTAEQFEALEPMEKFARSAQAYSKVGYSPTVLFNNEFKKLLKTAKLEEKSVEYKTPPKYVPSN